MAEGRLSADLRDLMIEHIDGPVPLFTKCNNLTFGQQRDRQMRLQVITRAVKCGWIEYDAKVLPKHTIMTNKGREVLAAALADWADCLCRAGAEFESKPALIADRMKENRAKA